MHHSMKVLLRPLGLTAVCGWPKRYCERSFIARQITITSHSPDSTAFLAWTSVVTEPAPPCGVRIE